MVEIKPEDMVDVRNVALLREIIPIVEAQVAVLERGLDNRMSQAIIQGKLTPEMAQQAWFEKFAYRRLMNTLNQKALLGQTIGEQHRAALEMNE